MADQKTNWKYILIIVFLTLGVGAGILGYWQIVQKEEQKATELISSENIGDKNEKLPTPIDTADWQTYQNKEYGFEFRYPKEWYVKQGETPAEAGRFFIFDYSSCQGSCPTKKSEVSFGVRSNDGLLSVSEWLKQKVATVGIEEDHPFSVAGFTGIKRIYKDKDNNGVAAFVIFPQGDKLNTLYYFQTSGSENIRILNKMLFEFHFLK